MKRRQFIAGLGSAAAWPLAVRAQQGDRVRRIGVLMPGDENDPAYRSRLSAFTQALADLGWTDGRNVRMEVRRSGADINRIRALVQELVGLQPDIVVTSGTPATVAVQRETRTIPIVFGNVTDPVASGIVARLATSRMAGTTDCLRILIHHLAKSLQAGSQAERLKAPNDVRQRFKWRTQIRTLCAASSSCLSGVTLWDDFT
jgi:ABC-type uncharacterized transport system substrate-binding protein